MSAAAILRLQNLLSLFISHGALNPVVTGSLLFLLTKSPLQVRQQLYSRISSLQNPQRLAKVLKTLVVLLALGVLRKTNEQFNKVALNAGRWSSEKKRWNLKQEVAVVTGGCSGIGLLIVKGLVKKGVRVAVLDVQQLPATLQGCTLPLLNQLTETQLICGYRLQHQVLRMRCHRRSRRHGRSRPCPR